MASTFSSWASSEAARPNAWNGDGVEQSGSSPASAPGPAAAVAADATADELKEALAAAQQRLKYFESFAPWIEEQMVTVVDQANAMAT